MSVASRVVSNVFVNVGIVLVNKYAFQVLQFPFAITLSAMHFVVTGGLTWLCGALGAFEIKPIPVVEIAPLAFYFNGAVVLMNLSLKVNSVGVYQLSKLLTVPVTVAMQWWLFKKSTDLPTMLSLALLSVGVAIATVSDVTFNVIGTAYALGGMLATAQYQLNAKKRTADWDVNSLQILLYQMPLSAAMLFPLCPVLEDWDPHSATSIWSFNWSLNTTLVLLLTCVLSFFANVTTYAVIGKTSAVTYQVVGHLKTCLVLVLGWLFFGHMLDRVGMAGVLIAAVAMLWYTRLQNMPANGRTQ